MSLLGDFAANEIGWAQVLSRLQRCQADYQRRAAVALGDEHAEYRGRMLGLEHVFVLLDECRKEFRAQP
jgi:hypothetical protein